MRTLLLAIFAISVASTIGTAAVVNVEKAAPPRLVGVEDKVYTLNVTSYKYNGCSGTPTFHVVKEGECLKTPYGMISPKRPVSDLRQCAAFVYCRRDFLLRDDFVCGECTGWAGNPTSSLVECHPEAKTMDFHFYNNMNRLPQRCKYGKYDTLNVTADGRCHYVTGLGSVRIADFYKCRPVGFTMTTGGSDCRSPDAEPSLSTITHILPSGKCITGIRVYHNQE